MLYLNPPLVVLDGVAFYPDSDDPLQFYYLPTAPSVARTAAGAPVFALHKWASTTQADGTVIPAGGILEFDAVLALAPAELARRVAKLQDQLGLTDPLRCAPIQAIDGSVQAMLLGQLTGGTPTNASHVQAVAAPAKPSLYGDNRASFSIQLDQFGTTLVEQSIAHGAVPVGVVYSLSYQGLRPAYKITAHASWRSIHTKLTEKFTEDGVFFGMDVSSVVDTLNDGQTIVIKVDNLAGDDAKTAIAALMTQVKQMVFETFFKPAEATPEQSPDNWSRFGSFVTGMIEKSEQSAITGGASSLINFKWTREDLTQKLDKSLDIDLSERGAITQTIYPQGHLADLIADPAHPPAVVDAINLDDPFFQKRNLTVYLNCDLKKEGINSVDVQLDYRDDVRGLDQNATLHFEPGDESGRSQSWSLLPPGSPPTRRLDVRYSYTVNLDTGGARWSPMAPWVPAQVAAPGGVSVGNGLTLSPQALYQVSPIAFVLSSGAAFPWDRYGVVDVEVRYPTKDDPKAIKAQLLIGSSSNATLADGSSLPGASWSLFQSSPTLAFDYQVTYRRTDGSTVARDWATSTIGTVFVDDPLEKKLRIDPPYGAWPPGVTFIEVQLVYQDAANGFVWTPAQPLAFSPPEPGAMVPPLNVKIPLVDPRQQIVQCTLIFHQAGTNDLITIPATPADGSPPDRWLTDQPVIRITGTTMRPHYIAAIATDPADPPFADRYLQAIDVFAYRPGTPRPPTAPTTGRPTCTLRTPTDLGRFEYDYGASGGFDYWLIYRYRDNAPYAKTVWTQAGHYDQSDPPPDHPDTLLVGTLNPPPQ